MFLESTISDIENYPFLNPFRFENDPSKKYWHISTLESLLEENWNSIEEGVTENREYLAAREKMFSGAAGNLFIIIRGCGLFLGRRANKGSWGEPHESAFAQHFHKET